MTTFYNEIEPYAAHWLRNLIAAGHIATGVVDERSIVELDPDELRGYTQCHFFAGIGVWSHALRLAGWPDDRPVWTGSCPCQPFSAAGKGAGFADERHLWPAFFHLIGECRPAVVIGEQVAAKAVDVWIDLVHADLEGLGYAFGAVPFPSAGVGAPHIRDRCYWVAQSEPGRCEAGQSQGRRPGATLPPGAAGGLGHPERLGAGRDAGASAGAEGGAELRAVGDDARPSGSAGGLAHDDDAGFERFAGLRLRGADLHDADGRGPVSGFWSGADWLPCRDEKWRPVEPGTQQMADGIARGVGRLRSGGDAEKEVAHATETVGLADQVLRALRDGHEPETIWLSLGGCVGVPQATLLLAAVCEQSGELGHVFNSAASGGPQERGVDVRSVWRPEPAPPRSPQGRGHAEQLAWQLGDVVPKLSQAGASVTALAGFTGSPLAHGATARVGRLRAYGNAINAEAAEVFIRAVMA